MSIALQWVTTAPNPRARATGHDAGQRGWRLHAVQASGSESFAAFRFRTAVCGLQATHGWGLDLFIDAKCTRCSRAIEKARGDS